MASAEPLTADDMLAQQIGLRYPGAMVVEAVLVARINDGNQEMIVISSSGYVSPWSVYGLLAAGSKVAERDWWYPEEDEEDEDE